jgi:CBS domain-containing protein
MQVAEMMTDNVRYVEVDDPLREAIAAMHDLDVRHVPVLDQGELVGIVSDRDLRAYEASVSGDERPGVVERMEIPVAEVMNTDVHLLGPEAELVDVIDLMIEHKIGAVPVVDPSTKELVGIVSYIDVLTEARRKI